MDSLVTDLQLVLNNLVDWFGRNSLHLNRTKILFTNFTPKKRDRGQHQSTQQISTVEFLGIHIDSDDGSDSESWRAPRLSI